MNPETETMNPSEAEDDPESYESSENEWAEEEEKKTTRRRTSTRKTAKKPKKSLDEEEESSDSASDRSLPKKTKNGVAKKKKTPTKNNPSATAKEAPPKVVTQSDNFAIGSFVISKQDAKVGDPNKHPWIWRIDCKSLLQKFEPFEEDGKIRHKSTFIYSGWSPMDMDDYAPLTVDIIDQTEGDVVVELNWEELKKHINNDSE